MYHKFFNRIILTHIVILSVIVLANPVNADHDRLNQDVNPSNHPNTCIISAGIPYWDQENAIQSFKKNVDVINQIALFWYYVTPKGHIRKYVYSEIDRDLIDFAHKNKVKVLANIANLPDDEREKNSDWDAKRIERIITSTENKRRHINELVKLMHNMNFDGVVIDYEVLEVQHKNDFSSFIKDLSIAFQQENKILAVAMHPKTAEGLPSETNGSEAQDWHEIGKHADQLHFMTYGEHTSGDQPGPIASAAWTKNVIAYARSGVQLDKDKVLLGLPLYAQAWRKDGSNFVGLDVDLTYDDISAIADKYKAKRTWDDRAKSPNMRYTDKNHKTNIIWYEDHQSIMEKRRVGGEFNVCSALLWRIGGEDAKIWDVFRDQKLQSSILQPKTNLTPPLNPAKPIAPGATGAPASAKQTASTPKVEGPPASKAKSSFKITPTAPAETPSEAIAADSLSKPIADQTEVSASSDPSDAHEQENPRLVIEAELIAEYNGQIKALPGEPKKKNDFLNLPVITRYYFSPKLFFDSEFVFVLDDKGDALKEFAGQFDSSGIFNRSLTLEYQDRYVRARGGRYEPLHDEFGAAPIFFGNYSTDLNLYGSIGLDVGVHTPPIDEKNHGIAYYAFYRDTSILSGEITKDRDGNRLEDGGFTNTNKLNNHIVNVSGASGFGRSTLRYSVGTGFFKEPNASNDKQNAYIASLAFIHYLPSEADIEISADYLSLHTKAEADIQRDSITFGIGYYDWPFGLGFAYSLRQIETEGSDLKSIDHIVELLYRTGLGEKLVLESAIQWANEDGGEERAIGLSLKYPLEWTFY